MTLKIDAHSMGMLNIEHENMFYGNIKDMYKTSEKGINKNGFGCQLEESLENRRETIEKTCNEIAERIYLLQSLLTI